MKKILLVDDDQDIRHVVQMLFKQEGYAVTALAGFTNVNRQVHEYAPDLILLDIMLGDMDGREICKTIKEDSTQRSIPIIIFSASDVLRDDVLTCGANDFIAKPFDITEMLAKVNSLLICEALISAQLSSYLN